MEHAGCSGSSSLLSPAKSRARSLVGCCVWGVASSCRQTCFELIRHCAEDWGYLLVVDTSRCLQVEAALDGEPKHAHHIEVLACCTVTPPISQDSGDAQAKCGARLQ